MGPFIASAKDFLSNRLFAWAELSFGESTFKLLITQVVHLLLSYVAGGAGRGCSSVFMTALTAKFDYPEIPSSGAPPCTSPTREGSQRNCKTRARARSLLSFSKSTSVISR